MPLFAWLNRDKTENTSMSLGISQNMSFHITAGVKEQPYGTYNFKITQLQNGSFLASMEQQQTPDQTDNVGALYYVVTVILLYGCSIFMMIASYIRKNNNDRKLSKYIKEMSYVRKNETRKHLLLATVKAATLDIKKPPPLVDVNTRKLSAPRLLSSVSETSHEDILAALESDDAWEVTQGQSLLVPATRYQTTKEYRKHDVAGALKMNEGALPRSHSNDNRGAASFHWLSETETDTDGELIAPDLGDAHPSMTSSGLSPLSQGGCFYPNVIQKMMMCPNEQMSKGINSSHSENGMAAYLDNSILKGTQAQQGTMGVDGTEDVEIVLNSEQASNGKKPRGSDIQKI